MPRQLSATSDLRLQAAQEGAAHGQLTICFQSADGRIEKLSREQLRKRCGISYTTRLLFAEESLRRQRAPRMRAKEWAQSERLPWELKVAEGLASSGPFTPSRALLDWLYGEQVRAGQTADLYLAKVDDHVGLGVFAGSAIEPGKLIAEYTGLVRYDRPDDDENPYRFSYLDSSLIDALEYGNYCRWINHSAAGANAQHILAFVDGVWHVLLIATALIPKGQQVLFNYGSGYWFHGPQPVELD